jgi:hypothetical protein
MSEETGFDDSFQLRDQILISARMKQKNDRPVLEIVQPALRWKESVFAIFCPQRTMMPQYRNSLIVHETLIHTFVHRCVEFIDVVTRCNWVDLVVWLVGRLKANIELGMIGALRIKIGGKIGLKFNNIYDALRMS